MIRQIFEDNICPDLKTLFNSVAGDTIIAFCQKYINLIKLKSFDFKLFVCDVLLVMGGKCYM